VQTTTRDTQVLLGAGAGLLGLAGVFLWRELQVPAEMLVVLGAGCAAAATVARLPRALPWAGPAALLATALLGGGWFALTKTPLLLVALGVTLLAAAFAAVRTLGEPAHDEARPLRALLTWYGLSAAALGTTWALYFHFFTTGFAAEALARRMVPTLLWMALGVGLLVLAQVRRMAVVRDAGFFFLAAALGKALLYDTTHLSGSLRVAALAAGGLLLVGGGLWSARARQAAAPRPGAEGA
jgi:hypothetical protein